MAIHVGELLSHSTEGFLHCANSDGLTALGDFATAVAEGEDNEEVEPVTRVGAEVGVLAMGGAKLLPYRPGIVAAGSGLRNDTGSVRFSSKDEISMEWVSAGRGQSCHGWDCG